MNERKKQREAKKLTTNNRLDKKVIRKDGACWTVFQLSSRGEITTTTLLRKRRKVY